MFRQSPRRNGRNKGLKIKHALQISVLLGVSIWLLYQVHHSNDKKPISVKTNVNDKPRNDSSKEMFKLGRKDLRPKVMETSVKDSKEEHEEIGDNKVGDGREDSRYNEDVRGNITKTEYKQIAKVHGEKDHDQSDVINGNIQTGHEGEQKEDQGIQKEVKELDKQIEEIKVKANENKSNEQKKAVVMDNIERKDKSKENGSEISSNPKEPLSPSTNHHQTVDESQLGSSQSHNNASTNSATNSEKEKQGDENLNNEVGTLTLSKEQTVEQINTTPVSYLTPSVDHETAASVDGNLTDSNNSNRNEKNDEGDIDSGAQDMEHVPNENKDDASVLEDEKDALTDLGTLPDNETGGHITSEDSDTE